MMYTDYLETPLGTVEIKASQKGIIQIIFSGAEKSTIKPSEITDDCKKQLKEYFEGKRKTFDLPLNPQGTAFQKSIWASLEKIPFGRVLSYRDIADMISNRKAVRAVGAANGRNPIGIIIPCHRVIGSDGSLTGYAGGIERKLWLLKHEGIDVKKLKIHDKLDIKNVMHTRQSKTQYLRNP